MEPFALIDDPLFDQHGAETTHPEQPRRLFAARAALEETGLIELAHRLPARDANLEELCLAHTSQYVQAIDQLAGQRGYLDADTYYGPHSISAAKRAAGGALALVDELIGGDHHWGVGLVRPPGHHARPDSAMGFCILNNAAIAAAHARKRGAAKVAIVDYDVHHGNGTQEIFYTDPNVLFLSLHQHPLYPDSGKVSEVGQGEGRGFTVNIPLSTGADDAVYKAAFERIVLPILEQFAPELLIVSAGFDGHHRDPLATMQLTHRGFAYMTYALRQEMRSKSRDQVMLLLEGGYDLSALKSSVAAAVNGLLGEQPPDLASVPPGAMHEGELRQHQEALSQYWKLA